MVIVEKVTLKSNKLFSHSKQRTDRNPNKSQHAKAYDKVRTYSDVVRGEPRENIKDNIPMTNIFKTTESGENKRVRNTH